MSIKQNGGIFGRNPTFNDVTIEGQLTFDGDIDVGSDLKVDGDVDVTGRLSVGATHGFLGVYAEKDNGSGYVAGFRASNTSPYLTIQTTGSRTQLQGINSGFTDVAPIGLQPSGGDINVGAGNFVMTSGYGIDFSATSGTGTSELLDDYEEGVWTPTAADAISGGNTGTTGNGSYTKIGNFIMVTAALVNIDTTGMTAGNTFHIQGLPFASGDVPLATAYFINSGVYTSAVTTASPVQSWINDTGVSALYFFDSSGAILVSDITSGAGDFYFTAIYQTA